MQTDNQYLNERNLQVFQDEVSNYLTDSDIDDPKYTPIHTKQTAENNALMDNDNFLISNHQRINSLKSEQYNNEANADAIAIVNENMNNTLRDKANEINLLKTEIFKLQESLQAKDIIIQEFEALMNVAKARFTQFEEANQALRIENTELKNQFTDYDKAITDYKGQLELIESNQKSIKLYEAHLTELQTEASEKEVKLAKRYQERESGIRKDYNEEIVRLSKELEDMKVENEKLKYEVSIHKVKANELQTQIDDKEYEQTMNSNKKLKEISVLNEQIHSLTETLSQLEFNSKQKMSINERDITAVNENANSLIIELNAKDNQIGELESDIMNYKQEIEMLKNEIKEIRTQCDNKDVIMDQMRNQNEELYKELSARENEMVEYDQLKQNEYIDYSNQITQLVRDKNVIEAENVELTDNLSQANAQLRRLNDLITDKYSPLENSLLKQTMKNENLEKKYKAIIKNLKLKEKSLSKENKNIKELLQERRGDYCQTQSQNQSLTHNQGPFATQIKGDAKNPSLYYYSNNNHYSNNNVGYNNNTNISSRVIDNSMSVGNFNYNTYGSNVINTNNTRKTEDCQDCQNSQFEDKEKKTLDEFKRLLNKIDEKLDLPIKHNMN